MAPITVAFPEISDSKEERAVASKILDYYLGQGVIEPLDRIVPGQRKAKVVKEGVEEVE